MFADFIKSSGKTRASWAERIGISRSYLSDLLNGKRAPSLEVAVRIERETGGAVPAACWIPQPAENAPLAGTAQAVEPFAAGDLPAPGTGAAA